MPSRPRILVICTANRCRSQMAEGWLRHFGGRRIEVASAGTEPGGVHPLAIRVMAECGVDISAHHSTHLREVAHEPFDLAVTVCDRAKQTCPALPLARKVVHVPFTDPDDPAVDEAQLLPLFRDVRDRIRDWACEVVEALNAPASPAGEALEGSEAPSQDRPHRG